MAVKVGKSLADADVKAQRVIGNLAASNEDARESWNWGLLEFAQLSIIYSIKPVRYCCTPS